MPPSTNNLDLARALSDIALAINAQKNIKKYIDGNGWTVYDFGAFKQYRISSAQAGVTVPASDRVAFSNIPLPVGFSVAGSRHIDAQMRGTGFAGDFFLGLNVTSTATTINGFIGNNYPGGSLATGSFYIDVTITDL